MSTASEQPSRQARLAEVLDLALERPVAERAQAIKDLCGSDLGLAAEAQSLLAALDTAGHLLEPSARAASLRPLTGLKIGAYQIGERVGAGGMGVVYRAMDTRLGRTVAVKSLPESLARDPERRARLEREARLLAATNHPNLAAIYSIEDCELGPVLVLEHVEGVTLGAHLERGRLPMEEVRGVSRQVLLALETAHGAGIVHRDIKPGNVMITPEGVAKVLDFGIAKQHGVEVADGPASGSAALTLPRSFVGTAAYMSPEQARGRATDRRTDIWAFGCILYEMLSGRKAFEGETISDTIASVLRADPDWSRVPASAPPGVCAVLRRCLEKDEGRRLRDAGDVRVELDEAWDSPASKSRTRRRAPILPAAALLIGAAIGAAALLWWWPKPALDRRGAARFTIEVPQAKPLRSDAFGGCVAVSPDGQSIVYSAGPVQDPGPQLYMRRVNGFSASPIAGTEHGFSPFFSPDGRWVGFFNLLLDGSAVLKRVPIDGGGVPQTIVTASGLGFGACWTEDNFIVFSIGGGIKKVPAAGGEVSDVCKPVTASGESLGLPEALPGGRTLLMTCTYRANDGYAARIEALTLESGQRRILAEDASCARYVPGLDILAFRQGGMLVAAPFNLGTLGLGADARPIGPVPAIASAANISFSMSPTGTLAYVLGVALDYGDELAWYYPDGRVESVLRSRDAITSLRLSPDSRRLAYTTRSANPALWVLDLLRGSTLRLFSASRLGFPVWSPDGKQLAISVGKDGQDVIEVTPTDGTSPPRVLYANPEGHNCSPSGYSPDGSELLIFMDMPDPSTSDIFVLTMPGTLGEPVTIRNLLNTPADRVAARVSPDGRLVTYASTETGRSEVYVQDYPGLTHKLLVSTGGGERPTWSSDSATIFYQSYGSLDSVRLTKSIELGADSPARLLPRIPFGRYDAAPDGSRFIMARPGGDWVAPNSVFVVVNADAEIRASASQRR